MASSPVVFPWSLERSVHTFSRVETTKSPDPTVSGSVNTQTCLHVKDKLGLLSSSCESACGTSDLCRGKLKRTFPMRCSVPSSSLLPFVCTCQTATGKHETRPLPLPPSLPNFSLRDLDTHIDTGAVGTSVVLRRSFHEAK